MAMELIDNINQLLGDSLKRTVTPGSKLKIAASCFSIYAFEALKSELESIESLQFIFTSPTFIPDEVTDSGRKVRREFHIPKTERERGFYGSEFEIQLKNQLTQRAVAKECAEWMRRKARFRSNRSRAPMQQFACVHAEPGDALYQPLHGFTAVDLGYQTGDAVSNFVNRTDDTAFTGHYLRLFDQIWNDPDKIEDVTDRLCEHIEGVYQENSPERIYFLMLFNIFSEFLEDITEYVLPNDLTGYQDSLVWQKLYNFQKDAATGIINKLETYNGCILADSVGLGKTFSALAVIKYYELPQSARTHPRRLRPVQRRDRRRPRHGLLLRPARPGHPLHRRCSGRRRARRPVPRRGQLRQRRPPRRRARRLRADELPRRPYARTREGPSVTAGLFAYPQQARRQGRTTVPKSHIYAQAKPTRRVQRLFVAQIDQIRWPYWLKPDTLNLPAAQSVPVINILALDLRTDDPDPAVLACIDKAIPAPVIFELSFNSRCKAVAAHKRPSEAAPGNPSKWVTGEYFGSGWFPADAPRSPLPVALNLGSLYEQLLRTLMPITARPGESLPDQAHRATRIAVLKRQCQQIESRLRREKQFNRKVEINTQLRSAQTELAELSDSPTE